jgi:phospholipid/cholesterol/gamma-HCH transport system substrate-binding protein
MMIHRARRQGIDPIWFAPVLIVVVVSAVVITTFLFAGTFRSFVPATLVSDRAGLVMEPRAAVKLRGVPVGEVASIGAQRNSSKLNLKLFPDAVPYIPSNVQAEIKATTAFGSKYVDLIVPDDPSPTPLRAGAVLHSRNVTVEVNTVFQNLQAVLDSIDPAKLNAILSAVAESLRGKGAAIGQAISDTNKVLLAVNPRMPTLRRDFQALDDTADIYSRATQDILTALDGVATTADTLTTQSADLDAILTSALGFGRAGFDVLGGNEPNLVRTINLLEPTTSLLMKYQPSLTCLLVGSKWLMDELTPALGGNGKSAILDATVLFGDDAYRYPQHLPKVNATGGPGGKPGCGSLPDPSANYPVRQLVTDTGFGTDPSDIRTNPGIGHPWYVDFFPVTRPAPEPPSYRGRPR